MCWLFVSFEPLQEKIIEPLFIKLIDYNTNKPIKMTLEALFTISGCLKCLSFWSVLAFTFNPFYAIAASIIGEIYKKLIK